MVKSREHVITNGKAAFYACIWPDIKDAALNCGWALGLHGSLSSDMDIMAMPWTENAKTVEELMKAISDCFTENPNQDRHIVPHYKKPNGRIVYTMNIWADFYLDINVIQLPQSDTYFFRRQNMRKQAITVLELTKGFTADEKNNTLASLEEMAGYILELTNDINI